MKTINESCERIESFEDEFGRDYEDFLDSEAYQYACSFAIMQIGESAKAIDSAPELADSQIPWRKVCGM